MSEQIFNTRIVHKHDTEVNWNKAINFIPKAGELVIYDPDENFNYARTKIGDGIKKVNDLPFINIQVDWTQNDETAIDYIKNKPDENDAIQLAIETELISPIATASGEILTDKNKTVFTL